MNKKKLINQENSPTRCLVHVLKVDMLIMVVSNVLHLLQIVYLTLTLIYAALSVIAYKDIA